MNYARTFRRCEEHCAVGKGCNELCPYILALSHNFTFCTVSSLPLSNVGKTLKCTGIIHYTP